MRARAGSPALALGPAPAPLRIAIFGLSITSSWGNGHATTYRALVRELAARGHEVWFFERDKPWYAENRDLPCPPYGRTVLYGSLADLAARYEATVREADLVIVGSYVPEGIAVGRWVTATARGVTAFYDIDTPVTVARLTAGEIDYLDRDLVRRYDLYLSFTGGPMLKRLRRELGARETQALYCSADPELYRPQRLPRRWSLGYLGTYSPDRQPTVDRLLLQVAAARPDDRFVVAGPLYPEDIRWPENVDRPVHLPPAEHLRFYNSQRFTLNVTRADMIAAGHSPSVRLFEAAACGVPIVSDFWPGLDTLFEIGREILVAASADDVQRILRDTTERQRQEIGARARARVLSAHTAAHRAAQIEACARERVGGRR
jgi:spore maturation protein CgeB